MLGLGAALGLTLVTASGGHSVVTVLRLLIAMASLVSEHDLQGTQASAVADSLVVAHGLRCPAACGIFPD